MPKDKPRSNSPLKTLAKKSLLWVVLPVALIVVALMVKGNQKSDIQLNAEREAKKQEKFINEILKGGR